MTAHGGPAADIAAEAGWPDAGAQRPSEAAVPVHRGRPIVFGFVPALDGLRAIAVFGVMLYHGGVPICGGGFMGVNVFFVLSGFLITSLLLGEWRKRMAIRLGQFWARRARRLLPALLLMLLGVAVLTMVFFSPGEFAGLRLDSLSTLFYVANWHFIFGGSNYFDLTAQPSPLAHMWSLSIEEQFYIVWPPVVLLLLRWGRRFRPSRRLWPVLAVAVTGAIGSAVTMAVLFHDGASATRLYEGTDTRSQDILVGAALAVAMAMWAEHRPRLPVPVPSLVTGRHGRVHPAAGTVGEVSPPPHRRDLHRRRGPLATPIAAWEITARPWRALFQVVGFAALGGGLFLWTQVNGTSAFLFEGGFFLFALGVAAVIFVVVTAQLAPMARGLGNPVFRYLGKISYGTYLWHYPLFIVLDASRTHLSGYPLLFVRIAVTLVVATASYYLVEQPIRRGRLRLFSEWKAWLVTAGACCGVVAATVVATLPVSAGATTATAIPVPTGPEYHGPPVNVLLFGDSLAFTAGWSISGHQTGDPYDVDFNYFGIIGCGVTMVQSYVIHGVAEPSYPACNASTPPDQQWPALWSGQVQTERPNVAIVLVGRWEDSNDIVAGRVVHIGEPEFDQTLRDHLEQAVEEATSGGAYVMLLTAPCENSGEQPNGQTWPEDSATRRLEFDRILEQVAKAHPHDVEVDDFGAEVCPGGTFQRVVDGITIRTADGVHFVYKSSEGPTAPVAKWLAWKLFPEAVRIGRLQMAGKPLS
jgi:peptidoglycan/LPS O-acetylase OafA/YrhL